MPREMTGTELKKKTIGTVTIFGVNHSVFSKPNHEQRLRDFVEHGSLYPGVTKGYGIVCHEKELLRGRTIPLKKEKKYYLVDMPTTLGFKEGQMGDSHLIQELEDEFNSKVSDFLEEEMEKDESFLSKAAFNKYYRQATLPIAEEFDVRLRNAIMAEKIEKVQKKHSGKRIAVFVGGAHVEGIAELLENKEKREEIIDEWKEDFKKEIGDINKVEESDEHKVVGSAWPIFLTVGMMTIKTFFAKAMIENGLREEAPEIMEKESEFRDKLAEYDQNLEAALRVVNALKDETGERDENAAEIRIQTDPTLLKRVFSRNPRLYDDLKFLIKKGAV